MENLVLTRNDALIIVDVQNDFLPGGSLAVSEGDQVIPVLNRYIDLFVRAGQPIYATRDWHPADHCSFKPYGGIWPAHCVQQGAGAQFAPTLALPAEAVIVSKATTSGMDAYSGFEGTDLAGQLRARGIERVFVGGLATDYCVSNTVKDALAQGFRVALLIDAIRAVDVYPDDGRKAIDEMIGRGARPIQFSDVEESLSSHPVGTPVAG
jgi:nicotinamidase/pyrazinamidase